MRALRDRRGGPVRDWSDPLELRAALLAFIADFANWDLSNERDYLDTSQALVATAHRTVGGPGARPLVVDSFAGGGTIPLEALRVGADAFASDLNPVAVLINRVSLEFIPRYRERLAEAARKWGRWVNETAAKELAPLYPTHPDGATPIAYLWARTIRCEGPACGADVPLLRSLWLARKGNRSVALRLTKGRSDNSVAFEVVEGARAGSVGAGTVARGSATCPLCGYTTRVERVRIQLRERHGGTQDARLYCSVVKTPAGTTEYRTPTRADFQAVEKSRERLVALRATGIEFGTRDLPPDGALGFRVQKYGIAQWREVFTYRQMLMLSTYASIIRQIELPGDPDLTIAVRAILGLTISKMANFTSSLCAWRNVRSCVRNTFGSQTLSMVWDYGEMNPYAGSAGDFSEGLEYLDRFIVHTLAGVRHEGSARQADAAAVPLPDDAASLFFTDPPYYDAIPYAHLSGYFATWLDAVGVLPEELDVATTSTQECIVDPGLGKKATFFERKMGDCLRDGRRVAHPQSLGVVVFAHKSTAGWEAQLQAMLDAGWVVTASWPIDTERAGRLRAIESAALASSVHLVCRPREDHDGSVRTGDVGDWREVLQELPRRIHEWLPRLAEEGVVGADAIFACLGPSLEVFSRYSRVEKVSGERVSLREYLEHVWAAVSREALTMIFEGAETAGLEPDARLTAIWLWTMASGGGSDAASGDDDHELGDEPGDTEDDNGGAGSATAGSNAGFVLDFDAVRKIAQGLGARLEELAHVAEIKGDKARLLPVAERAKHLFGKSEGAPTAKKAAKKKQMTLFGDLEAAAEAQGWGEVGAPKAATTTLDRVHQAMLLFGSGRGEAMKRFLVEEGVGKQGQFWKLAQSLSALYPSGSDEKRWVDGVLARKKGLGFG